MTTQAVPMIKRIDWRANAFRIVAILVGLLFAAISLPYMLWPWNIMPVPLDGVQEPDPWRWHAAVYGAYGTILSCVPLLLLLRRPREKPLLMQFWLIGQLAVAAIWVGYTWPQFAPDHFIMIGLILAAYPAPRELLKFRPQGSFNRFLLALTVVAGLAMVPVFVGSVRLHLDDAGSLMQETGQYMHATYIAMLVPLASFLAATRKNGWKELAIIAGITLLYLGLAAIFLPDHTGSWGTAGGVAAIIGGGAYIAGTRRYVT